MLKLTLCTLFAALAAAGPARAAALPFTCAASGDGWSVTGAPGRKVACTLRCILRDAAGVPDTVSCAPTVSPGAKAPACEGFLLGKHWTSATLVAGECSTVEPCPTRPDPKAPRAETPVVPARLACAMVAP